MRRASKTNVLFFFNAARPTKSEHQGGVGLWTMRANMPAFGKTRLLTVERLCRFSRKPFGSNPKWRRKGARTQGEDGRWALFSPRGRHQGTE